MVRSDSCEWWKNMELNRVRRGKDGGRTNIFSVDAGGRLQPNSQRCSCQGSPPGGNLWTGGSRRRWRIFGRQRISNTERMAALFYSSVDFTDASHWCVHRCIELSTDQRNKTTPWWINHTTWHLFNMSGVSCWQFSWLNLIFNNVILSLSIDQPMDLTAVWCKSDASVKSTGE